MKRLFVIGLVIVGILMFLVQPVFAVANTCASSTGVKTGTDASFAVTYQPNASNGVVLYLRFTQGAAETLTLTFETINRSIDSTNKYRYPQLLVSALSSYTVTIATTGNYRIPLPLISSESTIICNVTFSAANQGGAVVANFVEP
jgi:hypothetical protein